MASTPTDIWFWIAWCVVMLVVVGASWFGVLHRWRIRKMVEKMESDARDEQRKRLLEEFGRGKDEGRR